MTNFELADLFRLFRPGFVCDLVTAGFASSTAGAILNWFDPTRDDYLSHVQGWKSALCRGVFLQDELPPAVIQSGVAEKCGCYDCYRIPSEFDTACIQRVALAFYKAHAPARNVTDMEAVKKRLSTPPDLGLTKCDIHHLRRALRHLDECPISEIGSYGPGVTSEGYSAYDKWSRRGLIPPVPPSWFRVSHLDDWEPDGISNDFRFTKIAEVPKTLKSNRVVSSEPAQSMFAQLVVSDYLDRQLHRDFCGHVFLHDQAMHNTLLYGEDFRSIDLSDASDHVSCRLVSQILPNLWRILSKVRSTHSIFPDGDIVELATFAPMGSGVCFPILTIVNLALASLVCRNQYHVYGDDVIAHCDDVIELADIQEAAGLIVNRDKTCFHGFYRESCGLELYGSTDITPVYIRDPLEQTSYSKLNEMVQRWTDLGWFATAEVVRAFVARQHRAVRYNPRFQRTEVNVPVSVPVHKPIKLDGWAGIRKWFCTRNPARKERESLAFKESRVQTKLVMRFRAPTDYPYLPLFND